MINTKDYINKKYNKLTIIEIVEDLKINSIIKCKCDCGNIIETKLKYISYGHKKSCGCINKAKKQHGKSQTKLYRAYSNMIARCYNPKRKDFINYGAKGVRVCDEWLNDFMSFYNWAYDNGYNDSLTLDREDVTGNYEPNNCRWVDTFTQSINKSNTVYITYDNKTQSLKEWAEELDINYQKLRYRIKVSNMTIYEAFNTP